MKLLWFPILAVVSILVNIGSAAANDTDEETNEKTSKFTVITRPDDLHPERLPVGEKLRYIVSFRGVPAGASVLRINKGIPVDGRDTVQLKIISRTNKFFSVFYTVEKAQRFPFSGTRMFVRNCCY